jgi:hypothetical protein
VGCTGCGVGAGGGVGSDQRFFRASKSADWRIAESIQPITAQTTKTPINVVSIFSPFSYELPLSKESVSTMAYAHHSLNMPVFGGEFRGQ